jgi:glycosyltransferase involved in cell wall biosynthesis
MFKALGIPVICSPLPSYKDIIVHNRSGLFAETLNDWILSLRQLRNNDERKRIGLAGRDEVFERFGLESVSKEFENLFTTLMKENQKP